MDSQNRTVPEWSAPDTLLPAVMSAVKAEPRRSDFFAWSPLRRFAFYGAVVAAVAAAVLAPLPYPGVDPVALYGQALVRTGQWFAAVFIVRDLIITLVAGLVRNPLIGTVLAGTAAFMMATWAADVRVLYRILIPKQRSRMV